MNQHDGNVRRFGRNRIDNYENRVRIPRLKHIEISRFYSKSGNPQFGGLSPRDYLRSMSWNEQMRIGLEILKKFEVLK